MGGFIKAFMNAARAAPPSSLAQVVTLGRASSCFVCRPFQKCSSQILPAMGSFHSYVQFFFVFCFLKLSPSRSICQELFWDGLFLMENCDFGTVLYPFTTTINKVLYSVFLFTNWNWNGFEIKIFAPHRASKVYYKSVRLMIPSIKC